MPSKNLKAATFRKMAVDKRLGSRKEDGMKRIMVFLVAVTLLSLMGCDYKKNVYKTRESTQKWEYDFQFAADLAAERMLEALGAKGWEAIWCRRARGGSESDPKWGYECLFKRPKGGE